MADPLPLRDGIRTLDTLLLAGAVAAIAAAAVSLLARWWWMADLVTSFQLQLLGGMLPLLGALLWRRAWGWAAALAVSTLVPFGQLVPLWVGSPGPAADADAPRLRVLVANVLSRNPSPGALLDEVAAFDPDLVAVLELSGPVRAALAPLEATHRLVLSDIHDTDNFGIGLYSRLPVDGRLIYRATPASGGSVPGIVALVQAPDAAPLQLFVAHPMPPAGQRLAAWRDAHLAALGDAVGATPGPRLVVGDLNVVPWAPAFRDLARRGGVVDARVRRGNAEGTWPANLPAWLRVPIDHALVSPDLTVTRLEVGPDYGSDHRPVRVEVALPRQ